LYVAGARLVHFYPVSIATDYVGLNHTAFSYNGVMWISAVACRNMLPDPAFYVQCLRESFDELVAAAAKLTPTRPAKTRARVSAVKALKTLESPPVRKARTVRVKRAVTRAVGNGAAS
jgi:hypothetical protein